MERSFRREERSTKPERPVASAPLVSPKPAWLANRPVAQRASVLHALSRTAGNLAVARAVLAPEQPTWDIHDEDAGRSR